MRTRLAAAAVVLVFAAACSTSAPAPTVRPTLRLAPASMDPGSAAASFAASGGPDASLPDGPSSPAPVAGLLPPTPSTTFPDAAERQLIGSLRPTVQGSCARAGPFYPRERASVSCGDGAKVPFISYTLFANRDDMAAAYAADLGEAVVTPTANGNCSSGKYEAAYTIRARVAGRVWCGLGNSGGSTYRLIEWTRDNLSVLSLITSYDLSWAVLETFWRSDAGPFG